MSWKRPNDGYSNRARRTMVSLAVFVVVKYVNKQEMQGLATTQKMIAALQPLIVCILHTYVRSRVPQITIQSKVEIDRSSPAQSDVPDDLEFGPLSWNRIDC